MIVIPEEFKIACLKEHRELKSPVMMLFAADERASAGTFALRCVFLDRKNKEWAIVQTNLPAEKPAFPSLSKDMYSSILFEREIKEMFGIEPVGGLDLRRLALHNEVWPEGYYPLRKDFKAPDRSGNTAEKFNFTKVEGEGIFEVPVGPVHAGIIGPGHFHFSCAGEPIINLEIRLGFTHKGTEKLFEGHSPAQKIGLSECIAGDSAFAHSFAYCTALEKINGISVPGRASYLRALFLELERMYNHANDIGGMATDVGFSFPAALASIIKEKILRLNDALCGSRYLKGINIPGGVAKDIDRKLVIEKIKPIVRDFNELKNILYSNVSFMDRVEGPGMLRKKTAEDLGITGLAARASGIGIDLRCLFSEVHTTCGFKPSVEETGDALARLTARINEFEESARLVNFIADYLPDGNLSSPAEANKQGSAIGCAEGWRGPVLYWVSVDNKGKLDRVKIVDPSFKNWAGLSFAVLGDIIPDFPLCNKSFDLSYSGGDL
ncbi:MAG: NADH-quinone oxidoreductase subunit C [Candidatus Margulisiibacteriota bacterium]